MCVLCFGGCVQCVACVKVALEGAQSLLCVTLHTSSLSQMRPHALPCNSDPDAGMVFATSGGLLDPDVLSPPASSTPYNSGAGWPLPFTSPSPTLHLLYFGAQFTHTGGDHAGYPSVWQGVLRARLRREGLVGLGTDEGDPWAVGTVTTLPLTLPDPDKVLLGGSPAPISWVLGAASGGGGRGGRHARFIAVAQGCPWCLGKRVRVRVAIDARQLCVNPVCRLLCCTRCTCWDTRASEGSEVMEWVCTLLDPQTLMPVGMHRPMPTAFRTHHAHSMCVMSVSPPPPFPLRCALPARLRLSCGACSTSVPLLGATS